MHDPATLASSVRVSGPLFLRFLEGFDEDNRVKTAPGLPNHCSWQIGHTALVMHRCADYAAGFSQPQMLSTSDWIHGDGTAGDPSRYDTESVAFGSTPVGDRAKYPRLVRAREIFVGAVDRLAGTVESAAVSTLEREVPWGGTPMPVGLLVSRVVFHTGTHAGQLVDLRRGLGMPSILG